MSNILNFNIFKAEVTKIMFTSFSFCVKKECNYKQEKPKSQIN